MRREPERVVDIVGRWKKKKYQEEKGKSGPGFRNIKSGLPPAESWESSACIYRGGVGSIVLYVTHREEREKEPRRLCWKKRKKKILFFFPYFLFSPPDGRYIPRVVLHTHIQDTKRKKRRRQKNILPPTFWTELLLPSPSQGTRSCGIESQGGILGSTLLSRLTLELFSLLRAFSLHSSSTQQPTRNTQSSVGPSGSAARFVPSPKHLPLVYSLYISIVFVSLCVRVELVRIF